MMPDPTTSVRATFADVVPEIRPSIHGGDGDLDMRFPWSRHDFASPLRNFVRIEIPAGVAITEHPHVETEELYVILSGRGEVTLNGQVSQIGPGDVTLTRRGGTHAIRNTGDDGLVMLAIEIDVVDGEME